jgi:cell cycle checkpoint control protein RAD9A
MVCAHGVTKTYRLTYESVEVMHALFDRGTATNRWSIRSQYLREFAEFFAPKAEQLDVYCDVGEGKVTFLSFTEKIANAKNGKWHLPFDCWVRIWRLTRSLEVLKQPLKTSVAVDLNDFESFDAQDKQHIIISVKDFKAIVMHAGILETTITAYYTVAGRPLQFAYNFAGVQCQFTLMTAGDYSNTPGPGNAGTRAQSRASSRAQSAIPSRAETEQPRSFSAEMPPPPNPPPKSRRTTGKLGQNESRTHSAAPQESSQESESLFVRDERDEDDRRWDPADYEAEAEEMLSWNAGIDNDAAPYPTIRDSGASANTRSFPTDEEGIVPTQRVSQIKGLW